MVAIEGCGVLLMAYSSSVEGCGGLQPCSSNSFGLKGREAGKWYLLSREFQTRMETHSHLFDLDCSLSTLVSGRIFRLSNKSRRIRFWPVFLAGSQQS